MLALELVLNEAPRTADLDEARSATPEGIRFFSLMDVGDTEDSRLRLYELVREGVVDDPSNDGTFMSYEQFSAELFEPYYWRWAECQFLAADGRNWVGLVNLQLREGGAAEFGVTVVERAYRGRGIARALKLVALAYAHGRGITHLATRNDPRNEAIVRLNCSLGFRTT